MSSDFRRLTLRGFIVDIVVKLVAPTNDYEDSRTAEMALGIDYFQMTRTLCCDQAIFDPKYTPRRWNQEHDKQMRDEDFEPKSLQFFIQRLITFTKDRRLMVTRRRRLGTAATNAAVGDHVAVLLGGKVPVLLRPTTTGNQFLFVGQCYVEGIMDGQAMKLQDRSPNTDFVLV